MERKGYSSLLAARNLLDAAFPGKCWHAFIPASDATAQLATKCGSRSFSFDFCFFILRAIWILHPGKAASSGHAFILASGARGAASHQVKMCALVTYCQLPRFCTILARVHHTSDAIAPLATRCDPLLPRSATCSLHTACCPLMLFTVMPLAHALLLICFCQFWPV